MMGYRIDFHKNSEGQLVGYAHLEDHYGNYTYLTENEVESCYAFAFPRTRAQKMLFQKFRFHDSAIRLANR